MSNGLRSRALSAVLWSGIDTFVRQGLQFAISVVLARLLTPEEFGTVALLYLFIGIAGAFVDSGFSSALIQKQDVTYADESTVFWFNLLMGLIAATVLWSAAPAISSFYGIPILLPLTGVMALNILIGSLGSIHSTLLTKRLDFRTHLKVGGIASGISGVLAVILAWRGYGVWALAAQTLLTTLIATVLLWLFNPWRPGLVFSFASARRLFGFGGFLLASSLLDIAYSRIYTLLIGKFYGVHELGFYNRAETTKQLPVGVLTSVLSRVAFPIFSSAASDREQLKRGVKLALRGIMLINVPLMLGLAVTAEPFIHALYGHQWVPAAPVMQVLCLGAVLWPLHVINLNVLMAQGYSHLYFRLEVVKKLLGVALLSWGAFYGMMGIAWSQMAFSLIAFGINAYYSKDHLGYGAKEQMLDIVPAFLVSAAMAGMLALLQQAIVMAPLLEMAVLTLVGFVFYFAVCWIGRVSLLQDMLHLLRQRSPIRVGVSRS